MIVHEVNSSGLGPEKAHFKSRIIRELLLDPNKYLRKKMNAVDIRYCTQDR